MKNCCCICHMVFISLFMAVHTFWEILDSHFRGTSFTKLSVNLTNLVKIRKLSFLSEKVSLIQKIEVDLEQPL